MTIQTRPSLAKKGRMTQRTVLQERKTNYDGYSHVNTTGLQRVSCPGLVEESLSLVGVGATMFL